MIDWFFEKEHRVIIAMIVGVLLISGGIIWFTAAMEARSYNKFCDTPVTTWDAVWLDLRIDEC